MEEMVVAEAPHPFRYPSLLSRRHGPSGYVTYQSYRPWLRDEFTFRCAYCLKREMWERTLSGFDLDHFEARARAEELTLAYDNLVYSCHECNLAKGSCSIDIPTPTSLLVAWDGTITAGDDLGQRVIDMLSLDDAKSTLYRKMIIGIVRSTFAAASGREMFHLWMGFPPADDLPNLALLRCPTNTRPEGLNNSWYARRQRGELPAYYE